MTDILFEDEFQNLINEIEVLRIAEKDRRWHRFDKPTGYECCGPWLKNDYRDSWDRQHYTLVSKQAAFPCSKDEMIARASAQLSSQLKHGLLVWLKRFVWFGGYEAEDEYSEPTHRFSTRSCREIFPRCLSVARWLLAVLSQKKMPRSESRKLESITKALQKAASLSTIISRCRHVNRILPQLEHDVFIPDAPANTPPAPPATGPGQNSREMPKAKRGAKSKPGETPKWYVEGLVLLKNDHTLSDAAIARRVGISRGMLSKSKEWKKAREATFDGINNPKARGKKRERSNQFNDQFNDERDS